MGSVLKAEPLGIRERHWVLLPAMTRQRIARLPALLPSLATLALGSALACGGAQKSARPDLRSIEEGRAVLLIQEELQANGAKPEAGKDVPLPDGKTLHVEATVAGTPYGVAYVTAYEAERLGGSLPTRKSADELRIGQFGDSSVLLLYDTAYQYDVADTHTATAIAAEQRLKKDIADFVIRVVKAGEAQ